MCPESKLSISRVASNAVSKERLILALDGLDVQTIFISTYFFFINISDIIMPCFYTVCVEGPVGFLRNFQSVVDQYFYKMQFK